MSINYLIFDELRDQLRSWIVWILSWSGITLLLASVYQSFADEQVQFSAVLQSAPSQLLSTFNIQSNYLSSVETFSSGQFLTFFVLLGCVYGAIYGSTLLSGKIARKTIWYQLNVPLSRTLFSFINLGLATVTWFIADMMTPLIFMGFLLLFTKQESVSLEYFLSVGLGAFCIHIIFVYLGCLIGLLFGQSVGSGLGSGLAAGLWFVNSIGKLDGVPELIGKLTPFYYFDTAYVAQNYALDWNLLFVLPIIAIVLFILCEYRFKQMDISF